MWVIVQIMQKAADIQDAISEGVSLLSVAQLVCETHPAVRADPLRCPPAGET